MARFPGGTVCVDILRPSTAGEPLALIYAAIPVQFDPPYLGLHPGGAGDLTASYTAYVRAPASGINYDVHIGDYLVDATTTDRVTGDASTWIVTDEYGIWGQPLPHLELETVWASPLR